MALHTAFGMQGRGSIPTFPTMSLKEKILDLRGQGLSYNQISNELGCSKSTISYHCNEDVKKKNYERSKKYKEDNPGRVKIYQFRDRQTDYSKNGIDHAVNTKIRCFLRADHGSKGQRKPTPDSINFSLDDLKIKFGDNPKCYLSGLPIDWDDPGTWSLDHIVPVALGGTNTLDNVGLCNPLVNRMKAHISLDEFVELCRMISENMA